MPASPAHKPPAFRSPQLIFWVALGLRLAVILLGHTYRIRPDDHHFDFGFESGRIAQSLVLGHGYGNPFNGPSGPTAWELPLFPLLMALSFKLFGIYSNAAALFLMACNSVFAAATVPAVYEIAARCFDAQGLGRRWSRSPAPVAQWSAWVWALHPAALQYPVHWLWEMSLSTMLFTWTLVFALRLRTVGEAKLGRPLHAPLPVPTQPHLPVLRWLAFGSLWGLLTLSNASLLLCLPATAAWILWPNRAHLLRAARGPLFAALAFLAILSPWMIRNQRALHAFVPTRSNFAIEFSDSTEHWHDAFPWGTAMPRWAGDPDFQRYAAMGEIAYARLRGQDARARLLADPAWYIRCTLTRVHFFWSGLPHPPERHPLAEYFRTLSYAFISVCGLLGLGLALYCGVPAARLMLCVFLLLPLPYYAVTVQPRFRHPLEPLIAILAVFLFRSSSPKARLSMDSDLNAGKQ